jgi:hypothetical protein
VKWPSLHRRLFNFAAAASLVLCVATTALSVSSFRQVDEVTCIHDGTGYKRSWPVDDSSCR